MAVFLSFSVLIANESHVTISLYNGNVRSCTCWQLMFCCGADGPSQRLHFPYAFCCIQLSVKVLPAVLHPCLHKITIILSDGTAVKLELWKHLIDKIEGKTIY